MPAREHVALASSSTMYRNSAAVRPRARLQGCNASRVAQARYIVPAGGAVVVGDRGGGRHRELRRDHRREAGPEQVRRDARTNTPLAMRMTRVAWEARAQSA
jgi:hypothetical protein